MHFLTVGAIECRVVGPFGYSEATTRNRPLRGNPGHHVAEVVSPYIEAVIEVPVGVNSASLYAVDIKVTLTLSDGTLVEGSDMFAVGDSSVRAGQMRLRFEGGQVEVLTLESPGG